jgi:hypothetical protein
MATPALLGVDVGFSKNRKSTGLAWFANPRIEIALMRIRSARAKAFPAAVRFSVTSMVAGFGYPR